MTLRLEPFDYRESLLQQRRLFLDCFPETSGLPAETREHYHWKFHRFPDPQASYEYAAFDGEAMAGYYAAIPFPYEIRGRPRRAGMVCDVMTGSAMRGQGVFTKLGRYATDQMAVEGLAFLTGYPIRPGVIPGHLKVGWKVAFRLPMYIQVHKTKALLATKGLAFLAPLADLGAGLVRTLLAATAPRHAAYAGELLSRDAFLALPETEAFLTRWRRDQRHALVKTTAFLRWRLGAPGVDYQVAVVRREGLLVGAAIVRPATLEAVPCLAVLDLMLLDEHRGAMGALQALIGRHAAALAREAVVLMISPFQAARHRLWRWGYLRSPAVFSLILKVLDPTLDTPEFFEEAHWSLMWIDSDDL